MGVAQQDFLPDEQCLHPSLHKWMEAQKTAFPGRRGVLRGVYIGNSMSQIFSI
jgi:hypothetical protein